MSKKSIIEDHAPPPNAPAALAIIGQNIPGKGPALKFLRLEQGYESTLQFAQAVGVTKGTCSNWEREKTWPQKPAEVKRILKCIGIDPVKVENAIKRDPVDSLKFALNRQALSIRIIDAVSSIAGADRYDWSKSFFQATEQQILCSIALDANDGDNQARKIYFEQRAEQLREEQRRESSSERKVNPKTQDIQAGWVKDFREGRNPPPTSTDATESKPDAHTDDDTTTPDDT